ncbi:MAG: hypothetical protein J3K34DRAFT_513563 [Monoraphidium minutum]|nr:MAG: hypothetical protein J3K34DRAFT_513563 [Monoraphidium minutum]
MGAGSPAWARATARAAPWDGALLAAALLLALTSLPFRAAAAAPPKEPGSLWGSVYRSVVMLDVCLQKAIPDAARVVWPSEGDDYTWARQMSFYRDEFPTVVIYAYSTADVAESVKCAGAWGYQLMRISAPVGRRTSRRHSYQGRSVVSGYVVIDLSNITAITINKEDMTGNVGAGNTNGRWLHAVATSGIPGGAALIGSCASVGVTGFVLGGGQGDITPYVGIGSDQLVEAEVVLANGSVVLANKKTNKDLYWALQGGGGGFGIVTRMTLKIATLPDPDRTTWLIIEYEPSVTVDAILAAQKYYPKGDPRHGGGTVVAQNADGKTYLRHMVIFLGSAEEAIKVLKKGGLLEPSMMAKKTFDNRTTSHYEVNFKAEPLPDWMPPTGVTAIQFPSYAYAEAQVSCTGYLAKPSAAEAIGLPPEPYPCNQTNLDRIITALSDPKNAINVGISNVWQVPGYLGTGGIMIKSLPQEAWEAVLKAAKDPGPDDGSDYWKAKATVMQAIPLGINNHLSHGAVAKVSPSATAYRWRDRPISLTWDGVDLGAFSPIEVRANLVKAATDIATAIRAAIAPHLTKKDGGYINYMALGVDNFDSFYWGKNAKRLLKVKEMYDPNGLFSKPSTIGANGNH